METIKTKLNPRTLKFELGAHNDHSQDEDVIPKVVKQSLFKNMLP